MKKPTTRIYIDGANLYKGMKARSNELDYVKFHRYLIDKYRPEAIYMFLGFVADHQYLYDFLKKCGYSLIFKETLQSKDGETKGNCDAELVVQSLEDHYEASYEQAILVSGDGDFSCLINFWKKKNVRPRVLAPIKKYCSYLLRKQNISITYLDDPDVLKTIKKDPR
jgi:uncharacterized LabA/DUF88 family protein